MINLYTIEQPDFFIPHRNPFKGSKGVSNTMLLILREFQEMSSIRAKNNIYTTGKMNNQKLHIISIRN